MVINAWNELKKIRMFLEKNTGVLQEKLPSNFRKTPVLFSKNGRILLFAHFPCFVSGVVF